jgi:hypothetical protein
MNERLRREVENKEPQRQALEVDLSEVMQSLRQSTTEAASGPNGGRLVAQSVTPSDPSKDMALRTDPCREKDGKRQPATIAHRGSVNQLPATSGMFAVRDRGVHLLDPARKSAESDGLTEFLSSKRST